MKVLLLCNRRLSAFDCSVIESLRCTKDIELAGALVNIRSKGSFLKRARREWKKGRGGFVLVQAVQATLGKLNRSGNCKASMFLRDIPLLETESLYRDTVYQWIKKQQPDCLLLRGFGIIKEPILSIAPFGVLSYHHGDLTKYRGGPPAFWELYHNESEIGITLQILDQGVDTGTIVLQQFFPITKNDTWSTLRKRIYEGSVHLAREALLRLKSTGPVKRPVGAAGRLYTLPNLTQWLNLQLKLAYRRLK